MGRVQQDHLEHQTTLSKTERFFKDEKQFRESKNVAEKRRHCDERDVNVTLCDTCDECECGKESEFETSEGEVLQVLQVRLVDVSVNEERFG